MLFRDFDAFGAVGRVESDEHGDERVITTSSRRESAHDVGLTSPRTTAAAWKLDPMCVECRKRIANAEQAALVVMPNKSHRVAHRRECFVKAIVLANPAIVAGSPAITPSASERNHQ